MGSRIDKKKFEALVKQNAELKKQLDALGITVNNLEEFYQMSDERQMEILKENYAKLTEGGIIITVPPVGVECGPEQHWDTAQGKCVDNVVTPPPTQGGGEKNQYGINKIYADKGNGVLIPSTAFSESEFTRNYASGKPSENSYECEYKDSNKLENEEVTFYTQINGFKNEPDTMSVKLLGNKHSDGSKDKWLIFELMTDGSDNKTFEIERSTSIKSWKSSKTIV